MGSPVSVTSASISMSGKTGKTGVSCIFTCVTAAKNTTSGRARIRGAGCFRTASTSISDLPLSPQKAASETGRPTQLSVPITEAPSCRMSHVERKSKYTKLAKLPDNTADSVVQACARVLLPLADRIETITYDNGKEFASHVEIATSLGSLSYFAKPYHSWERGLNEHTNGLFRQYFPKGSDLSIVSDTEVQRVEDKLNSRPRKILGYRTPREVFFNAKNLSVALRC